MRRDHFVARTYLKHFGDPQHGGMLHCYRKSNRAYFRCWPRDVCHEWGGDLNLRFLPGRPELLGELRKLFEPNWDSAIARLASGRTVREDKLAISGYMANLATSTPAWKRIGIEFHNHQLRSYLLFAKEMQEKHGGNDKLPVEAISMIERGEISIRTDPDYVKAFLTRQLLDHAWITYHQDWFVLHSRTPHLFVTSDNPVAILNAGLGRVERYLPIRPDLCFCVTYHRRMPRPTEAMMAEMIRSAPLGDIAHLQLIGGQVRDINVLVTKCADDLVFSAVPSSGIGTIVNKYSRYRVSVEFVDVPSADRETIQQRFSIVVRENAAPSGRDR